MTVAPLHAIARRASSPLALLLVALVACSEGADGPRATRRVSAGAGTEMESAGEVVIEAPGVRYTASAVAAPGTISGTVRAAGTMTQEPPVATGKDSLPCGPTIADSVPPAGAAGLGGVVVWLDGIRAGKPVSLEKRIELESDRCRLTPRVQAALAGGSVNVIGHDNFRQHLLFMAGGEEAPRATVLLGKDEQVIPTELPLKNPALIVVRDGDHSWPRAWIAVFDHPYFAVTTADGTYRMEQVPAGSYTLVAWHERGGRKEQKVTVAANGAVTADVTLNVK